ncbi:MAG: PqqD family protein [Thermodesulfobacteriota bacterium]|nr:PqqD family protein [Thermodesulfobacteriota bacterium]
MKTVNIKSSYAVSNDVISKEIDGEIVIVPLESGIGNLNEGMFSLNKTGKIIWEMLDGKKSWL